MAHTFTRVAWRIQVNECMCHHPFIYYSEFVRTSHSMCSCVFRYNGFVNECVRHDSFVYNSGFVRTSYSMCSCVFDYTGFINECVCHHSFMCYSEFVRTLHFMCSWVLYHSGFVDECVCHHPCIYMPWLMYVCVIIYSCMRHDSINVTGLWRGYD